MSHLVLRRNWKPVSDLSYNPPCFAGGAPSVAAPTADWGVYRMAASVLAHGFYRKGSHPGTTPGSWPEFLHGGPSALFELRSIGVIQNRD